MKNITPYTENAGFTLIEIMIALFISLFFVGMVYTHFLSQRASYQAQEQVVEMQQSLRAGITAMTQELRMAGYDPYVTKTVGIVTANPTDIEFTYVADDDKQNNDGDGQTDETGELATIAFDHYVAHQGTGSAVPAIGRKGIGTKAAVAENIENLEFRYLNAKGEEETTNLEDIRFIQISVLARVGKKDHEFSDNKTYTTAKGTTWGPYNDGFRRRFQIITVNLRNMGG